MDDLRASYRDEIDEDDNEMIDADPPPSSNENGGAPAVDVLKAHTEPEPEPEPQPVREEEPSVYEEVSSDELSEDNDNPLEKNGQIASNNSPNFTRASDTEEDAEDDEGTPTPKKQKQLDETANQDSPLPEPLVAEIEENPSEALIPSEVAKLVSKSSSKKSKKKNNNNVWTRPTSRKGKKKNKNNGHAHNGNTNGDESDKVLITPVSRFPDKNDDSPDAKICLSKVYKAEKVELSEDRLSAGSIKGYRMVRATRGVVEGAWYFEIKVVHLGETGHTRLGWSMEKGDLQAPVGYDGNSFGYRDIDGCKVHKALRENYGEEGYKEGDVVGFYINLPEGKLYAPDPPRLVWYKGQRYASAADTKEDHPKVVPGSEISFFKNGVCQGTAFKDLYGGRYYPAASMYTLPNQPNCTVKFNFGPNFEYFPEDFGGRPIPRPMIEVPYHAIDAARLGNGTGSALPVRSSRLCPMLNVVKEEDVIFVDAAETFT